MKKILIATGNQGKFSEILEGFILHGVAKNIEFLSLNDFSRDFDEPEESGENYEENALIKAKHFAEKFNIPTIGEDSGLELAAFPEKFGLKTRREISAENDAEWLAKFLEMLKNVKNRQATFFSAIAFYNPTKKTEQSFLGTTSGTITKKPETELEHGIPVSAVFTPESLNSVFSAMSKMQKNKISHRGKSVKKMSEFLIKNY